MFKKGNLIMATKSTTKKVEWNPDSGVFVVPRSGAEYKTKRFGNQVWMVDPLSVKESIMLTEKQALKAVPKGWRIPTRYDIIELENYVWETYKCAPVHALMARRKPNPNLPKLGISGLFWENGSDLNIWYMQDNGVLDCAEFSKFGIVMSDPAEEKTSSYGCCMVWAVWDGNPVNKDAVLLQQPQDKYSEFLDSRDGQSYKTVKFGEQEWFAENLRFGGDSSGYSWVDFIEAIPEGWRIPTYKDLAKLEDFISENCFFCGYDPFKKVDGVVDVLGLAVDNPYHWNIREFENGHLVIDSLEFQNLSKDKRPIRLVRDSSYTEEENRAFRDAVFAFSKDVARTVGRPAEEAGEESYQLHLNYLKKVAANHRNYGSFTDPRDGEIYKTISLNGVTWMAENLRYKCEGSFAYDDDETNVKRFGRLYTLEGACPNEEELLEEPSKSRPLQGVAPEGWHIATAEEWAELMEYALSQGLNQADLTGGALLADDGWEYEIEKSVLNEPKRDRAIYLEEAKIVEKLDVLGLGIKPAGLRNDIEEFTGMGLVAAYRLFLRDPENIQIFGETPDWMAGNDEALPIRCVKNADDSLD